MPKSVYRNDSNVHILFYSSNISDMGVSNCGVQRLRVVQSSSLFYDANRNAACCLSRIVHRLDKDNKKHCRRSMQSSFGNFSFHAQLDIWNQSVCKYCDVGQDAI